MNNEVNMSNSIFYKQGYVQGDVNEYTENSNNINVNEELNNIINNLNIENSNSTDREEIFKEKIIEKCNKNPLFKRKLCGAIKSGAIETVKVLTKNPFVSVPIETVKGWIEAS